MYTVRVAGMSLLAGEWTGRGLSSRRVPKRVILEVLVREEAFHGAIP